MSHYAKLAIVGIRLLATLSFLLGVINLLFVLLVVLLTKGMHPENWERFTSALTYLIAGIAVYALSKPIGRLLGRAL